MPEWSCWNCLALCSGALHWARPLFVLCSVLVRSTGRRRNSLTLPCTQVHDCVPFPRQRWHTSGLFSPLSFLWRYDSSELPLVRLFYGWTFRRHPLPEREQMPPAMDSSDMASAILITLYLICCHNYRIDTQKQKIRMKIGGNYEEFLKNIAFFTCFNLLNRTRTEYISDFPSCFY